MYRFVVWLIALALVVNGAVGFAWADAPGVPPAVAHGHHDGVVGHQDDTDHIAGPAADAGQAHGLAHDHFKCCGWCNVVSLLPGIVAIPVTFFYATILFGTTQRDLVGHFVALDPGIPKSAV